MSDTETTSAKDAQNQAAQNPTTGEKTGEISFKTTVGGLLSENRKRAGLDIADVARVLRISQKYLQALEEGRNADLPGTPYAIGFVRSYAEHLHLDGEEIVRRYKAEVEGLANKTDLIFPKPIPDGGVPGAAVLGLGVFFAAVAYGVWYWNSNTNDIMLARVDTVPEHIAAPAEQTPDARPDATAQMEAGAPESQTAVADSSVVQDSMPEEVMPQEAQEGAETDVESSPAVEAATGEGPLGDEMSETVAQTVQEAVEEAPSETAGETAQEAVEQVEQATVPAPEIAQENAQDVTGDLTETVTQTTSTPDTALDTTAESAADQLEETTQAASEAAEDETEQPQTPAVADDPAGGEPAAVEPAVEAEVATLPTPRENVGPSRITVRAKSNSWIQVRDEIADRLLFTRLLREGDAYEVPNRSGLRLMTGNAGALELLVDGEAVPVIGEVGEVRRNVELDADKLKSGAAVSE